MIQTSTHRDSIQMKVQCLSEKKELFSGLKWSYVGAHSKRTPSLKFVLPICTIISAFSEKW